MNDQIGKGFPCGICGEEHRTSDINCNLILEDMKIVLNIPPEEVAVFLKEWADNQPRTGSTVLHPIPFAPEERTSLPISREKLWKMAKLIVQKQKHVLESNPKEGYWENLEGAWFDYLEEELFGEQDFMQVNINKEPKV